MKPVLSARAISFSYGPTTALRAVDLDVAAGEILALTGPSGSGKSTLMLCLAGVLRPSAGEMWFGDVRIDALSQARRTELRRGRFGVLFQFGQLVPELTAAENVALPLLLGGVRRRQALTQAGEWLDRLDVGKLAAHRPGQMSGGQQQRVALARAVVTKPEVLFTDEPTGALDSLSGETVLTRIVQLSRESGTAVVLVTHDATVAAYADREVLLRDGCLDFEPTAVRSARSAAW